ncbi:unnamed protein product [Cylicocyclus nassatus]|uniref:3'-5' exoribonuclease Rv2179c-like domain-containing protein n=1 Tax=Cylicocyclus nassatus TaxID=53992 RepID=A0AA36DT87_CYLNA|nr:unnamed protein product [Cylicocyclus nassatus]
MVSTRMVRHIELYESIRDGRRGYIDTCHTIVFEHPYPALTLADELTNLMQMFRSLVIARGYVPRLYYDDTDADFETAALDERAAILSVACVPFVIDSDKPDARFKESCIGSTNYLAVVDATSCVMAGLHFDQDTVDFWARQSDEAKAHLMMQQHVSVREAIEGLVQYIAGMKQELNADEVRIWSQGTDFDIPKLRYCTSRVLGIAEKDLPWKYFEACDARSFVLEGLASIFGRKPGKKQYEDIPQDDAPKGSKHDPLYDCRRTIYNKQYSALIPLLPYIDLERDWGARELPDSTPSFPSLSIQGEVTLRPLAENPDERVVWVNKGKLRPAVVGDSFVRLATTTQLSVKECLQQCRSNEECHNTTIDDDGAVQMLDADQWRANTVVIADSPFDAIAAHSMLAARARRRVEGSDKAVPDYLHFAFLSNPRKFDKPVTRLKQVAISLIVSPGTDFQACQRAFAICNRHSTVLFMSMPQLADGIVTLHDFTHRYELSNDERVKYQGSKASMLFDLMAGSLTIDPFLRTATIDKKTGNEKDYNFQLQIRSAWLLMQSRGYVRVIDPTQPDKVGRYYKVTGNIVDELNRESLMSKCLEVLTDYARSKAKFGTQDFAKMSQAIRTAKTLSASTASDLPVITLDRRQGYGPHIDHFFFRNGALRITPEKIELVPYDRLGFFVDAPAILPWDYTEQVAEGIAPFRLFENPEYATRRQAIADANLSPKERARQNRELYDWARLNRWCFDPTETDWHGWWPFMKVIRCYANEEWEEEEELEYEGHHFSAEQQQFLNGRIINLLSTIGRIVYRYRTPNFLHYMMENAVSSEGVAQGGSGKSMLVNTFIACVRNVLSVDSKKLNSRDDIETSVVFNAFRPGYHDIVHVEDYERDIKRFYNYVTGNFEFRKFHTNETVVHSDEAPAIVITSNYAIKDGMDDSSAGRLNLCGFSHYFHRENENLNLVQRGFDTVMPDFSTKAEYLTAQDRSQIIYVCALAVQFVMGVKDKILAPARNLKERNLRTALGDSFFDWASDFFSKPYNLGVPIDFQTIFQDYIELSDSSEDKQNKFSPKAFTQRLQTYCQNNDLVYMPEVAYRSSTDRQRHSLTIRCWVKKRYFDDPKLWDGRLKVVRELTLSRKAVVFYPIDKVPKTYGEVEAEFIRFWDRPDPEPVLDEVGNPVTVSAEERQEWNEYIARRRGKSSYEIAMERSGAAPAPSSPAAPLSCPAGSTCQWQREYVGQQPFRQSQRRGSTILTDSI